MKSLIQAFARALFIMAICATASVHAHKASDAFLRLQVEGTTVAGRWDIALRDLALVLPLDADGDGDITWGELRARQGEIAAYALAQLQLAAGGPCASKATGHKVERHTDGVYAVIEFAAQCPRAISTLDVRYGLLAQQDAQHRGLLTLVADGKSQAAVLRNDAPPQRYELSAPSAGRTFSTYLVEGIWHIWTGFDHLLFLITLLLPAVLVREGREWRPRASSTSAAQDVFWVVTAFTLAHSITLAAAATGWVSLPSRWVESVIALSVVLAALNNIFPVVSRRRWPMAFGFGLVHGLGFASALIEMGLPQGAFALALAAFNLGVEVGQIAVVLAVLPLALWLRHGTFYRRGVMTAGSLAIVVVAGVWLVERSLDVNLMPFGAGTP